MRASKRTHEIALSGGLLSGAACENCFCPVDRLATLLYQDVETSSISPYSERWQCTLLLLFALRGNDRALTKAETTGAIEKANWFAISAIHRMPYQSKVERGQREARWKTMIAFARKDCVMHGHLCDTKARDWWEISSKGLKTCQNLLRHVAQGHVAFERCNLWTMDFCSYLKETALRTIPQETAEASSADLLPT